MGGYLEIASFGELLKSIEALKELDLTLRKRNRATGHHPFSYLPVVVVVPFWYYYCLSQWLDFGFGFGFGFALDLPLWFYFHFQLVYPVFVYLFICSTEADFFVLHLWYCSKILYNFYVISQIVKSHEVRNVQLRHIQSDWQASQ